MSKLAERGAVLQRAAAQELTPEYRQWLRQHPETVDSEGFQVVCAFAPSERAEDVLREVNGYNHPLVLSTLMDGRLVSLVISDEPPDAEADTLQLAGSNFTIEDVARAMYGDQSRGVMLLFSASRTLVASR